MAAASVFISYSRRDAVKAQAVQQGLEQRAIEAWRDTERIRPAEDFRARIRAEIVSAHVVVVVLSVAWLQSIECAKELQCATEQHKKLVVVAVEHVDAAAVPDAIERLNWIFLRDGVDEPAPAFDRVVAAIRTDLPWVAQHARLGARAADWDQQRRNASLALRGVELRAAEAWLSDAAGKETTPTELQVGFIVASRAAATRRQRTVVGLLSVAAIVVTALGVGVYFQRAEKERQRTIALAHDSINESRVLRDAAGDARQLHDAVRAGARALAMLAGVGAPLADADENLRAAMAALPAPPSEWPGPRGELASVRFDRSATLAAVAYKRGTMIVVDAQLGRELARWEIPRGAGAATVDADLSAAADRVAVLGYESGRDVARLNVYRLRGDEAGPAVELEGRFESIRIDASARRLYLRQGLRWRVVDVDRPSVVTPLHGGGSVYDVEPSPDGRRLAIAYRDTALRSTVVEIVDADTLAAQVRWPEPGRPRRLKWAGDGRRIVVQPQDEASGLVVRSTEGGLLARFDAGRQPAELQRFDGVAASPDGSRVAYVDGHGVARVRGLHAGDERVLLGQSLHSPAFLSDGSTIATIDDGPRGVHLQRWERGAGAAARELKPGEAIEGFSRLPGSAHSRQQRPAATLTPTAASTQVRIEGAPHRITIAGKVVAAGVSRDAGQLFALVSLKLQRNGTLVRLERWHLADDQRQAVSGDFVVRRDEDLVQLSIAGDDRHVVTRDDSGFVLWDADRLQRSHGVRHSRPDLIAWQLGGPQVATTGRDRVVRVWSQVDGVFNELARIVAPGAVRAVEFSDDGRWLATQDEAGAVRLWALHPVELAAVACGRVPRGCGDLSGRR